MIFFVTGATGFLGGHIVDHLRARGHEVRCLVRPNSDRSVLGTDVTLVEGDLDDAAALDRGLGGASAVIHSGALTRKLQQKREDLFRVNQGGTVRLLDACERQPTPPRMVLVSTLSAVGAGDGRAPVDESAACRPRTDYGASKLASEEATLARRGKVPFSIVRLPGVFGPRDPNMLALFRMVGRGLRPAGRRGVSFVHARDAAEALLLAATRPEAEGEILHAAGEDLSVGDMGRAIAQAMGARTVPLWTPGALIYAAAALTEAAARLRGRQAKLDLQKAHDLTADWRVSSEKIRARLGWRPEHTFAAGMAEALAWYRGQGLLT